MSQADPSPVRGAKKKKKLRGAWISFVGRIVAQIVGAISSVMVAVLLLQQMQISAQPPGVSEAMASPARLETPAAARLNDEITIAVLPFENFSGDATQDAVVDALTEAVIADLAHVPGLWVISRTSVMRYRGERMSLPQIANELHADLVIEGSLAKAGDRVRITAQLINGRTDVHVWARSYDRTVRDVLSVQADVATEIANAVRAASDVAGPISHASAIPH